MCVNGEKDTAQDRNITKIDKDFTCYAMLSRYTDEFVRNAFVLVTIKLKSSM